MTPSRILAASEREIEERYINDDAAWLDHLRLECAKALASYFQEAVNTKRPIESLSKSEMLGAAEAVTSEWIVQVSRRIGDARTPSQEEYTVLLAAG